MSVEQSIRKRKREANFATALGELDEELHELHSALATAVTEFEALLHESLERLPEWADVDHDELRELFRTDLGDQRVMIGPRAASFAAARVETFVRVWVSPGGQQGRPDSFDDAAAQAWRMEVDEVTELVALVAERGREAARTANGNLSEKLEELTASVAEQRDTTEAVDPQLEALRRKLRKGKVGTALLTRQSEAEALEEQRRKTEQLEEAWSQLEQLAFAGAEMGVDASVRLNSVLQRAIEVVVDGYPELVDVAGDWVSSSPIRERKFNVPPPVPAQDRDGSPSSQFDVDDAHRVTIPIEETQTEELARSPQEPESGDDTEDEEPRLRYDTEPPRTAQDTPLAPASTTATMEVIAATNQFREPAFRITTAWERVAGSEVALALGPPAAYVLFITSVTIAYHTGLRAENPFVAWPWALPIFFAFAIWAVGMPMFSNWRVEWDGARPRPVRLAEHRDRGFVDLDYSSVEVDGHRLEFRKTSADLTRWRERSSRGWALQLEGTDGTRVLLGSVAESPRWDDSTSVCADSEPDGEWRISEEALLHIADSIG